MSYLRILYQDLEETVSNLEPTGEVVHLEIVDLTDKALLFYAMIVFMILRPDINVNVMDEAPNVLSVLISK